MFNTPSYLAFSVVRLTEGSWQKSISFCGFPELPSVLGTAIVMFFSSGLIEIMDHWLTAEDSASLFFAFQGQL